MPETTTYTEDQIEFAPQQVQVERAREEVRHAQRLLDDIENLEDFDFETLSFVIRSLRRADEHLTAAINQVF